MKKIVLALLITTSVSAEYVFCKFTYYIDRKEYQRCIPINAPIECSCDKNKCYVAPVMGSGAPRFEILQGMNPVIAESVLYECKEKK